MTDPANPTGPVNPANQGRSAEPVKPGTDKFKDLMKIDSNAEKQKKKKKRSEEAKEERKAEIQAGPASPSRPADKTKKTQKYPKIQKIGESEKKQTQHQKRSEETPAEMASEEAAAAAPTPKQPVQPLEIPKGDKAIEEEKIQTSASYAAEAQKDLEEIIEQEELTVQEEQEISEAFKKVATRKEEPQKAAAQELTSAPATTLGPLFLSPATQAAPAYALLDAQTLALFEKMVSLISILKDTGVTETTLHLNTPEFANSPYYGAQIIIREYSTAPLTYNIELIGNPLAADLFRRNLPILRSAFDDPKLRFRVHRLDTSIERPVERKEETS